MKSYKTADEYIQSFPKEVQEKLNEIRSAIKKVLPKSLKIEEEIKYGIPTFVLKTKKSATSKVIVSTNLIHFGGFKKHVSLFPGAEAGLYFKKDLLKYETSKGTIKFPLDTKLPLGLISKITKFRLKRTQV